MTNIDDQDLGDEIVFDAAQTGGWDMDDNEESSATNGAESNQQQQETAKWLDRTDDGGWKIGDDQLTDEQLRAIIDSGRNVGEKEAAATQKFQEASELRKQFDADPQIQAVRGVAEALAKFSPDQQEQIFQFAADLEAGRTPTGRAHAQATPGVEIPEGFIPSAIKWDDMSPEGQAIMAVVAPQLSELSSLKSQLASLGIKVDEVGKVIPEVQRYVQGTKTDRAQASAIASLKESVGIDVTPAELQDAVKSTGISDPEAAWLKVNAAKVKEAGAAVAQERKNNKPIDSPTSQGRSFDPKNMTADQIVHRLSLGETMLKS